ncbi:MAG: 16S rRNA (adenine(1518)-N(6)/adenine(1519)-N(6))-dimethyltransferase RsmA [Candidatus Porifericomitaceae bacterium WSBS_2022_MAG_OTU9]
MNKTTRGSRHKPRLGQHLLHDQSVIERIVTDFAANSDDFVVEIGPGRGALTKPLLQQLDGMHAVEKDPVMVDFLRAKYGGSGLTVHTADAVRFAYQSILPPSRPRLRIIGNLPYSISTPLLFSLIHLGAGIQDMMFMMQREVAERLLAEPGTSSYGRLTVMVALYYQVQRLCDVAPGSFAPPPKVQSTVLRFSPLPEPMVVADGNILADMVRCAFSARRKTLANALAPYLDAGRMVALGIDPKLRPGELSVQQYVQLAKAVATI